MTEEHTKEFEHFFVSGSVAFIADYEAVSIITVVLRHVCCLLQQWHDTILEIINHVLESLSVWTTNINRVFTNEFNADCLIIR